MTVADSSVTEADVALGGQGGPDGSRPGTSARIRGEGSSRRSGSQAVGVERDAVDVDQLTRGRLIPLVRSRRVVDHRVHVARERQQAALVAQDLASRGDGGEAAFSQAWRSGLSGSGVGVSVEICTAAGSVVVGLPLSMSPLIASGRLGVLATDGNHDEGGQQCGEAESDGHSVPRSRPVIPRATLAKARRPRKPTAMASPSTHRPLHTGQARLPWSRAGARAGVLLGGRRRGRVTGPTDASPRLDAELVGAPVAAGRAHDLVVATGLALADPGEEGGLIGGGGTSRAPHPSPAALDDDGDGRGVDDDPAAEARAWEPPPRMPERPVRGLLAATRVGATVASRSAAELWTRSLRACLPLRTASSSEATCSCSGSLADRNASRWSTASDTVSAPPLTMPDPPGDEGGLVGRQWAWSSSVRPRR